MPYFLRRRKRIIILSHRNPLLFYIIPTIITFLGYVSPPKNERPEKNAYEISVNYLSNDWKGHGGKMS
jgi:hypothetical protein